MGGSGKTGGRLTTFHTYKAMLLGLESRNLFVQPFDLPPEFGLLLQLALAAALGAEAVGLHALVAPAGAALVLLAQVIELRSIMQDSTSYTILAAC